MKNFAIFDFDNTLSKSNSGFVWTLLMINRFSLWSLIVGFLYVLRIANYDFWIKTVVNNLKNEDVKKHLETYEKKLKRHNKFQFKKKVASELLELDKRGYKIIIITQSIDFVVKPFIKHFENQYKIQIDHFFSTKIRIKNNRFDKVTPLVGKDKHKCIKKEDLKNSYFYTDSSRDENLLKKVKYPVVVNPGLFFTIKA